MSTAHPRSRGENSGMVVVPMVTSGSSPLTRGKPRNVRVGPGSRGLIPAHAGKTTGTYMRSSISSAHPRSRGENVDREGTAYSIEGSSPLTRGKPQRFKLTKPSTGLIPAHAGKTPRPASRGALGWAHPRSRGENHDQDAYPDPRPGSSPLTRGKPRGRARTHHRPRLIPAHAGKTGVGIVEVVGAGAHPRSRGENIDGQRETAEDWGSSPLTRGKQRLHRAAHHYSGLIPAHAGKTPRASRQRLGTRAHPRSRGENCAGYAA